MTLKSFRLVNSGSTTATITLYIEHQGTFYPITPLNLRLDPADMALDDNVNMTIPARDHINLHSDSLDVFYWIELE